MIFMKISQTIGLIGVSGLLLAGILAPTIYATEDGQFPVFPTVIDEGGEINEKSESLEGRSSKESGEIITNESGVFSPWGFIKSQFTKTVFGEESGVIFTLESLSSKPDGRGDLHY